MPTTLPETTNATAAERSRRNVRTVILLSIIAAAFYFGFIAMNFHGG
jgi:hypothetical protein